MQYTPNQMEETSVGLKWNIAVLLSYLIPIIGVIFLFVEKKSRFVKFHAAQATTICIAYVAMGIICVVPVVGWIIAIIGYPVLFIFMIIALVNALNGVWYKIPLVGDLAQMIADAVK